MPPRTRGRGEGPPRDSSSSRGRGRSRGGTPSPAGRMPAPRGEVQSSLPASHITTVGVRRPGFGKEGRAIKVRVNACVVSIPEEDIRHYDVVIDPETGPRVNMKILKCLQCEVAPNIFTSKVSYDGRKNIYVPMELNLGPTNSREFTVMPFPPSASGPPPRPFTVRLTKVATIRTEVLRRFVNGQQSRDNSVSTALMAMNVAIRMDPLQRYPTRGNSFFTPTEKGPLGLGAELWRGYFQSVRPAIGRLLINVDISTAMFYKPGSLVNLCLEFVGRNSPNHLSPAHGFPARARLDLQSWVSGVRVTVLSANNRPREHTVTKLSAEGAQNLTFSTHNGQTMTVAQYWASTNRPLTHPNVICANVGRNAWIPLEKCTVLPGQIVKKQIPPSIQTKFVEFATKKPVERLQSIRNGVQVLQYGQSEYIRRFGMQVDSGSLPMEINARVINTPTLLYGIQSKEKTIRPRFGAWNMVDKKLIQPAKIEGWFVVIYENQARFNVNDARKMVNDFIQNCEAVGVTVADTNPLIQHANAQRKISDELQAIGSEYYRIRKMPPTFILVVLPEGGNEIYRAVKHFGDVLKGTATQCVISSKAKRAKAQYWANVLLKVNPKLGGCNHQPDAPSVPLLTNQATLVMGADVMHPAPGTKGIPSFAALVCSVDSMASRYIATDSVQSSRQEIIADLKEMVKTVVRLALDFRKQREKKNDKFQRIIFYRDGVAENQFSEVLEKEVALLQEACREIDPGFRPKITFIVVGKRHHYRFFPDDRDADRSGNCPAGMVVDTDIAHPTEFDFYLQSHAGILGTSRSAHYSVLLNENNLTPDGLQSFSYALCHLFARSTRSVSIPAPVYYADIICARAKSRFDPDGSFRGSDAGDSTSATSDNLEMYKRHYQPLHISQSRRMYFM